MEKREICCAYPNIDLMASAQSIKSLRLKAGYQVRQLQGYFGFENPQAIYKWERGESMPTLDNMMALGRLYGVPIEQIVVLTDRNKGTEDTPCKKDPELCIHEDRFCSDKLSIAA